MMDDYYGYQPTILLAKPLVLVSFVNELTRAVANSLVSTTGMPLRLLDDLVEHRLGTSSIELLAGSGLETWRETEKLELANAVQSEPLAVIALGEGALSEAGSLELVLERCDLVYLYLSFGESRTLALKQATNRKATLLAEISFEETSVEDGLESVFARRRTVYERAHHSVDAWRRSPMGIGESILALLK